MKLFLIATFRGVISLKTSSETAPNAYVAVKKVSTFGN